MSISIVVIGAAGRLGSRILELAAADDRIGFVGSVTRSTSLNTLIGEAPTTPVVIDVSTAGSTIAHVKIAVERRVPLLVATTGLTDADRSALQVAAKDIPVLVAANLSIGAHVLRRLTSIASALVPDADAEIVETHHRHKKDAPSGTALMLASTIENARPTTGQRVVGRAGDSVRTPGEIGVQAVRGGDVVGEHTVTFYWEGERIELTHRATNRDVFARGAVRAALFLDGARGAPKTYDMVDVVGEGAA